MVGKVLAALVAVGLHAPLNAQETQPQLVTIELSSFAFTPSELTLQHGHAYRLHLVNTSSGGHDFTAPEFFAASDVAPQDRALVTDGKVRLSGHATADIALTPEKAGTYKLHCSHMMHASFGMRGTITVQ